MVLLGIGQIGCSPNELAKNSPYGKTCVKKIYSANEENMWHIYTGVGEKVFKDDFESQLTI